MAIGKTVPQQHHFPVGAITDATRNAITDTVVDAANAQPANAIAGFIMLGRNGWAAAVNGYFAASTGGTVWAPLCGFAARIACAASRPWAIAVTTVCGPVRASPTAHTRCPWG